MEDFNFKPSIASLEALVDRLDKILINDEESDGEKLSESIVNNISEATEKGEELIELLSSIAAEDVSGSDEEE